MWHRNWTAYHQWSSESLCSLRKNSSQLIFLLHGQISVLCNFCKFILQRFLVFCCVLLKQFERNSIQVNFVHIIIMQEIKRHRHIFGGFIWQAKHDKSGLSWKSPIESQWSMCEIEKSLCEIGKSLCEIRKSLYEKLKLLYENEKMSCEITITTWVEKLPCARFILTVDNEKSLWEKKKSPFEIIDCIFFLSWWDITSQRRVFWQDIFSSWTVEQLSAEDFRVYWLLKELLQFILCIWSCRRITNLCKETWGTHKNARHYITVNAWQPVGNVYKNFHWKILSNFLIEFDVSSEL